MSARHISPVMLVAFVGFSAAVLASCGADEIGSLGEDGGDARTADILVKFKASAKLDDRARLHRSRRANVLSSIPELRVDQIDVMGSEDRVEELLQRYRSSPLVEYVEINQRVRTARLPNDPDFASQWALETIRAPAAWDLTIGSSQVVVADIDTGIDYTHPDLAANIWNNSGEIAGNGIDDDDNGYVDDVRGWNFYSNNNVPYDDHGHGTHTSGASAAVGDNGVGVTGVAWQTKVLALNGGSTYRRASAPFEDASQIARRRPNSELSSPCSRKNANMRPSGEMSAAIAFFNITCGWPPAALIDHSPSESSACE